MNLLQDFSVQVGEDAPDMFLMDINPISARADGVDRSRERAENVPKLIPVLRARIVGVRGRDVNLESYEDVRGRGGLSREFTITYRSTRGERKARRWKWWDATPAGDQPEVSIEESLRERFNIQIGDEMRFDVLGRIVSARVSSFREVDFRDFRAGGFMIVFRPGPFDNAPHSFIAAVKGGRIAPRARLQGLIVAGYPNISVIDLREVLDTSRPSSITSRWPSPSSGALVLLSGSLILDRRGLDDEVPPRLRSGDSEDARREQPAHCHDAAARVRRARRHCRNRGRGGRDRPQLGSGRDSICRGSRRRS